MTWLLIDAAAVGAHDLGVVRVRLLEVGPGHYVVEARVPPVPEFEALLPTLAPRCRMRDAPDVRRRETSIDMRLTFDCGGAALTAADVSVFRGRITARLSPPTSVATRQPAISSRHPSREPA